MRIGIYGSSFDPITYAHLWTASTVAEKANLDKVIFLPSSSGRVDKNIHANFLHRYNMVKMAIEDNNVFEVSDYEFHCAPWDLYTYITMRHFREKYKNDEVFFIMGADCLKDVGNGKWAHSDELISENNFIVMSRGDIDMLKTIARSPLLRRFDDGSKFRLIDKGLDIEISSTYIRDEIGNGGNPRYLLPDECYLYILDKDLYRRC